VETEQSNNKREMRCRIKQVQEKVLVEVWMCMFDNELSMLIRPGATIAMIKKWGERPKMFDDNP